MTDSVICSQPHIIDTTLKVTNLVGQSGSLSRWVKQTWPRFLALSFSAIFIMSTQGGQQGSGQIVLVV